MSEPVPTCRGEPGEEKGSDDSCLIDDLDALFLNSDFSDVTFVVDGERIHANIHVLAARCAYFSAVKFGRLRDNSKAEIRLEGTTPLAFRALLRYIYTSRIEFSTFEVEDLLAILLLAHGYGMVEIQRLIVDYLEGDISHLSHMACLVKRFPDNLQLLSSSNLGIKKLDINNVLIILRNSMLLFDDLTESCMQLVDQRASEVLASRDFLTLNEEVVMKMLSRNTFSAAEIDIFKAISEWIRAQPSTEGSTQKVLVERLILEKCLRLDLISSKELLSIVARSEIFEANSDTLDSFILDAFKRKHHDTVSDMRGAVVLDESVVTLELGAAIVEGENRDALLKAVQEERFDGAPPLTRHRIGQPDGIVVQLGRPYRINCVRLWVHGFSVHTICSYKVEVSMDRHNWVCVAKNTRCGSFPLDELIFDARLVRYIRVLGVYNSRGDEYFSLVYFGALCSSEVADFVGL